MVYQLYQSAPNLVEMANVKTVAKGKSIFMQKRLEKCSIGIALLLQSYLVVHEEDTGKICLQRNN